MHRYQHYKFAALFLFLAVFSHLSVQAKKITFPVSGLMVTAPEAIPIEIEWDENWLLKKNHLEYHHEIARIAALLAEIAYVPVQKNPDSNELLQTYRLLGVKDSDIEWNYDIDYETSLKGDNQSAYSFAFKDIKTPSGTKKLVFIVLRGTPMNSNEWISNVNVSDSTKKNPTVHEGFEKTAYNIELAFYDFLKEKNIAPEEAYFLVTGHSRGAALANLLGAAFADYDIIPTEHLFVYTFATPNVSQEDKTSDPKYNFIWNIVNAEDIVPTVPPNRNNWKWKKFGRTKVLVNYWNSNPEVYLNDYVPRMNEYYNKLLLRNYAPFKTGPFIHIQVARILTSLYKTVGNYYGSFFGLRKISETLFKIAFPSSDHEDNKDSLENKQSVLTQFLQNNINKNLGLGVDYAINAFIDMHACESYLSFLLALDENEAFSELENSQIVIEGSYDCAVYNEQGELLGRILDGAAEIYKQKAPVALLPLMGKNVIGLPTNQNLTVVIHKDSLIPTIVPYKIEHYNAAGILISTSDIHYFFPHTMSALRFNAGKINSTTEKIDFNRLAYKEAKPIIKKYGLKQNLKLRIQPEFSMTSDKIFSLGFRNGTQMVYGTVLADFFKIDDTDFTGMTLSLGHQQPLYGRIMFDIEAGNSFLWGQDSGENRRFNSVPTGTFSLSYKPRHRVQFFTGVKFDLHIKEFNDEAFSSKIRKELIPKITVGDKTELFPSLTFGFRI